MNYIEFSERLFYVSSLKEIFNTFIIACLQNIVFGDQSCLLFADNNDFSSIFGNKEIKMNRYISEYNFISLFHFEFNCFTISYIYLLL